MDGFGGLQRQYDALNRRERNIETHSGAFNATRFWERAVFGQNFLITGGDESARCHMLAEALCEYRKRCKGPIVVLNRSEAFESHMIQLAKEGKCGRLVVSSPDYPNYTPFVGLDNLKIRDLFQLAGQKRGYSTDALGSYVEAFLQVLSCRYETDIFSMTALAELSDAEIVALGESYGVARLFLDTLKSEKYSGEFRQILKDFWSAFNNIVADEATGVSLANMNDSGTIYLIWTGSEDEELLSMELAKELIYLQQTRRMDLLFVLNDAFGEIDRFMESVIINAKKKRQCGVCSENVLTGLGDAEKSVLENSPTLIVMYTGIEDREDTNKILEKFGTYTRTELKKGIGGKTPGLFHLPFEMIHPAAAQTQQEARVDIDDMKYHQVAVRGDQADRVSLYRRVKSEGLR